MAKEDIALPGNRHIKLHRSNAGALQATRKIKRTPHTRHEEKKLNRSLLFIGHLEKKISIYCWCCQSCCVYFIVGTHAITDVDTDVAMIIIIAVIPTTLSHSQCFID